jgi:1-pyrroline-5-carboxylate dehydrogenase
MSNEVVCPKCGSNQISANKKGFSGKKAIIGGLLVPFGLLAGTIGSNKIIITCLSCGHQFGPGENKKIIQNVSNYSNSPKPLSSGCLKTIAISAVVTALARGAFEYHGQKCSAASRAYIPSNMAEAVKTKLVAALNSMKMGTVEDFSNFINAVIDEKSFNSITKYINNVKKDRKSSILVGGNYSKTKGYFIEPTVILTKDPKSTTMCEEIFGPVLTIYIYDAEKFEATLSLLDSTSNYALTGAILAQDRAAVELATNKLRNAAGNFYINDKPTGAVVGQQPFGGARASGTNDKAGSQLNLYRWLSARTIKETFNPPTDYRYSFLNEA